MIEKFKYWFNERKTLRSKVEELESDKTQLQNDMIGAAGKYSELKSENMKVVIKYNILKALHS